MLCSVGVYSQDSVEVIQSEKIQLMCTQSPEGEYIIRNNLEYQQLLDERSTHPNCDTYELPLIDFEKYVLIGYVSGVSGCSPPDVSHIVTRKKEVFLCSIIVHKVGGCKLNNTFAFWVLLPKQYKKLNIDFEIIFK